MYYNIRIFYIFRMASSQFLPELPEAYVFVNRMEGHKLMKEKPFLNEAEFEDTICKLPDMLKEIFCLKRQVRGGNKMGRPDLMGIDAEKNICIIEMKNVEVDTKVIAQILGYATWAEMDPNGIKILFEDEKVEGIEDVDWDNLKIRTIIIAPSFAKSTLENLHNINNEVELFVVKRFQDEDETIFYVHQMEPLVEHKVKIVKAAILHDDNYYKEKYPDTAESFLTYVSQIQSFIKEKKWELVSSFNGDHCSFKNSYLNIFGVQFSGRKDLTFFLRINKKSAMDFTLLPPDSYNQKSHEAVYTLHSAADLVTLMPLIELAYKKEMK